MAQSSLLAEVQRMRFTHHFHGPARLLMAALFLWSGLGKLGNVEQTQGYMEAFHVPGYLLWPAATFEISSGLMLLVGMYTRQCAMMMAGWCVLTAVIFHVDFKDQNQQIMFMKNMTMAGGFLVLSDHGAPEMSWGKPAARSAVDEERKFEIITEKRYGSL